MAVSDEIVVNGVTMTQQDLDERMSSIAGSGKGKHMLEDGTHCAKCFKITEVFGSKWCATCYYPGIDQDYEEYQSMLREGYRRADAAVRSGWKGAEEI